MTRADTPTELTCSKCGEAKPLDQFYKHPTCRYGYNTTRCKGCQGKYYKAKYQETPPSPEQGRKASLWRNYKITPEEYDRRFAEQDGRCKICKSTDYGRKDAKFFAVDHCHTTGRVRALLCLRCNVMIGFAQEDPVRLEAAAQYLRDALTTDPEHASVSASLGS